MSVQIIAEAGVNHNGSIALAEGLIDAASAAGADVVKFQTFKTGSVVSRFAPKAPYQVEQTGGDESQYEMIKKLELDDAAHRHLLAYCRSKNIVFLSTPFDLESLDFLVNDLKLPRIKVASGEITNAPLLLRAASTGKPVLLSTGMSTLAEVEAALGVVAFGYSGSHSEPTMAAFAAAYNSVAGRDALRERVTLLHCTTEYPTPFQEANLRALETLRTSFGLSVGYSDHTIGLSVSLAAVALGATVIEKHFTLDRTLPGPDHSASLEPAELASLVRSVREVEQSLGSALKAPTPSEKKNIPVVRRSLVAAHAIRGGEAFSEDNLTVKRPGTGVTPFAYWDYLGKTASRDYAEDELIELLP
jgi:N-acetylneuraminate synthase